MFSFGISEVPQLFQKIYQGLFDDSEAIDDVEDLKNELNRLSMTLELLKERLSERAVAVDESGLTLHPSPANGELTNQRLDNLESPLQNDVHAHLRSEKTKKNERSWPRLAEPRTVRQLKESIRTQRGGLHRVLLKLDINAVPGGKVDETVANAQDDDIGFVEQIEHVNSTSIQTAKEEHFMEIDTCLEAMRLEGLESASRSPAWPPHREGEQSHTDKGDYLSRPELLSQKLKSICRVVPEWSLAGASGMSSIIANNYDWSQQYWKEQRELNPSSKKAKNTSPSFHESLDMTWSREWLVKTCKSLRGLENRIRNSNCRLPKFVTDPSPALFLAATFTYGMATISYFQLHRNNRYQPFLLVGGIIAGISLGLVIGLDAQSITLKLLPWVVLVSLLLSTWTHRMR